jgi:hypothetical protein
VGVALSPADYGPHVRLNDKEGRHAAGITGFWVDIDVKGEAHKKDDLPETIDQARELARSIGLPPTEEIDTAHGLQAYWEFTTPWIFQDDADRQKAADLVRRFQALLKEKAKAKGWEIDSTPDLPRVFRLPGTFNCKIGDPVAVRVLTSEGPRYELGDFLALVPPDGPSGSTFHGHASNGITVIECARRYVKKMPEAVSSKRGHAAAFAVAQVIFRGFALSEAEGRPILEEYNQRCQPPWSEKELDHKIRSAIEKSRLPKGYLLNGDGGHVPHGSSTKQSSESSAPTEPEPEPWVEPIPLGQPPPASAFPLDVLPDSLQQFVREAAAALPCPPDYLAVPLLVMAGGMIGASRALAIKAKHVQRAALYAAVIGSPGTAKTPALEAVVDPVHELDEAEHAKWELAMEKYESKLEDYEDKKKEAKKNNQSPPEKPQRPLLPRLTVDDATAESLAPILKENPRGVVMVADELLGWVQRMNCYREGGKGADRQFWLSAWSGKTTTIDRKKTHELGPIRIRKPFIGVIGGLTPDKLPTLRGDKPRQRVEQDGFIDRLLLTYPVELPATEENWADVSEDTNKLLADAFAKLRTLDMVPIQDGATVCGWRPFVVNLDATGKTAWQQFTRQHANERNKPDFPLALVGPWAKFRGYGGRLALIVHFLRWACGELESDRADVDGESMARAVRLVDYFKAHARKVYALIDADPRIADARHVLQWLKDHPEPATFSRRDVHQGLRRNTRFENPENLAAPLKLLEEYGYVRAIPVKGGNRPGRQAAPKFERNPLWVHPQNPQNPQNGVPSANGEAAAGSYEDIEDIEDMPEEDSGASGVVSDDEEEVQWTG